MQVHDTPVVVEQVNSEVQGAKIRQLVPPIQQIRRGLQGQITLGEEITIPNPNPAHHRDMAQTGAGACIRLNGQ